MSGRRAALLGAWLLVPFATMAGCGATTSSLDIRYPETMAHRALLSSVAPRRIQIGPVADRRADPARIGVKPTSGEPLVTSRPVTDIVREALVIELTKNAHAIVVDRPDVMVEAEVDEFWLDVVDDYATTQYIGRAVIALAVSDGRTGAELMARRYVGIKRRETEAKSEATCRDVMDAALTRAMRDVATDPELVSALAGTSTAGRASLQRGDNPGGIMP